MKIMHSDKIDISQEYGMYLNSKHLSNFLAFETILSYNVVSKSPAFNMLSINFSICSWTWYFDGLDE